MDIGIDLGTTFSVIAVVGKVTLAEDYPPGIYLEESDVTIIPSPLGEPTFPSVVIEDPTEPSRFLFGREALQCADEGEAPITFSKRRIGTAEEIRGRKGTFSAREVARLFLEYLKQCAEKALGKTVTRAVITHPAHFDRGAVEETRRAAAEAGFDMTLDEQMLMEPVAAALTYTRTDRRDPLHILTYDLGGGTFDVTFLVRTGGVIDMRAFDGDHLLGGYNFDRELLQWVRSRLKEKGHDLTFDENDPVQRASLAKLLRVAEEVKIQLATASSDSQYVFFRCQNIVTDGKGRNLPINERITRAEFTRLIQRYLDKTIERTLEALKKADMGPEDVNEVLLVGGSSNAPWIVTAVSAAFPKLTPKLFEADLCVAAGAALYADMALPKQFRDEGCRLTLDVPASVVLDTVTIAGQASTAAGQPLERGATVSLRQPDGSKAGPEPIGAEGQFCFDDVVLTEEENRFQITVDRADGSTLAQREFTINYAPESTETSRFATVLPRPLSIMTQNGLIPLAREGVTLPARVEQTFERQNNNPNISLKLYQGFDHIGEVRIENIPPEAGAGSLVDLRVEVTATNHVRGTARVRTRDDAVVASQEVGIHFDKPVVPDEQSLRRRCAELDAVLIKRSRGDLPPAIAERGKRQIDHIHRLLEQQPLERQEVHVALRDLNHLLNPPDDHLSPSRREFCALVERCRQNVTQMIGQARVVQDQGKQNVGGRKKRDDASSRGAIDQIRQRAEQFSKQIDQLEEQGLAAHEKQDQKGWSTAHESLQYLQARMSRSGDTPDLPTALAKLFARLHVMQHVAQLEQAKDRISAENRITDWRSELAEITAMLHAVVNEVQAIEDELPSEQCRARIGQIFRKLLEPARARIEALGVDVRVGASRSMPV